jgi:ammonium transporter, Amt family
MDTDIGALTVIFTEFYYWVTIALMFLIHVGFCMYEVAASRAKNTLHTLMKNTMVIPFVTVTFYLFGWWIYFAFPNGPFIFEGKVLVEATANAVPWSELMDTPRLADPVREPHLRRRARQAEHAGTAPAGAPRHRRERPLSQSAAVGRQPSRA